MRQKAQCNCFKTYLGRQNPNLRLVFRVCSTLADKHGQAAISLGPCDLLLLQASAFGHWEHDLGDVDTFTCQEMECQTLALDALDCSERRKGYDVIDTSDLMDSVGILNLLPAATPLLCEGPHAVLYTESMGYDPEDT